MSAGKRMPYRDIRPSFLCYTLCFPLAMIFINAQNRIMPGEISVFHFTVAATAISFFSGRGAPFVLQIKKYYPYFKDCCSDSFCFIVWDHCP